MAFRFVEMNISGYEYIYKRILLASNSQGAAYLGNSKGKASVVHG
jgi:hypothetical protein